MLGLRLGSRVGPFAGRLDPEVLQKFAAATNDPSDRVRAGKVVPPAATVTQLWDAQNAGRAALIPLEFQAAATGGVHGEHDLVIHRPIVPGEPLQTFVEGRAARTKGSNSLITLRYMTFDAREALVAEHLWTTVWLGVTCEEAGDPLPSHALPEDARQRPLGSWCVDVDADMARLYAEVSRDWSPHHFDVEAARRSGADGPFLHGLCTMALCAQGASELLSHGNPERLARIAVRFARPLLLGEQLAIEFSDAGPLGYAFEAEACGTPVITRGRVALR